MQAKVTATGVLLRLATEDEVAAIEGERRRGAEFDLPGRSHSYAAPLCDLQPGDAYVVAQSFVEFERDGSHERWDGMEYHGRSVPTDRDATLELLALVEEASEDLVDLFADMRIARLPISRGDFEAAPSRMVVTAELDARLAPRRRG